MAKKISELNDGVAITGAEELATVQSSETVKVTPDAIKAHTLGGIVGDAVGTTDAQTLSNKTFSGDLPVSGDVVAGRAVIASGQPLKLLNYIEFAHNFGTVPANSQVELNQVFSGTDDIGMVAMANCNGPVSGLVYTAQVDADGTVDLIVSNITNSNLSAGNRTYTVAVVGFQRP